MKDNKQINPEQLKKELNDQIEGLMKKSGKDRQTVIAELNYLASKKLGYRTDEE